MAKRLLLLLPFLLLAFVTNAAAQSPLPSHDDIRKILVDRIDRDHQSVGIVVGVIEPSGRRIISYGTLAKDDKRPVDGDTVFEIGSITKVFTSLILADMVQRREVALDDPIAKYLPPQVRVPERNGRQITLEDLSTHTSGLPRLPNNMKPADPANPYADYSVDQLYQFLSTYTLPRDIGSQFEYSNLGGGLLGHLLARRAGTDYEALVRSRILGPLKMPDTAIRLTPAMQTRLAVAYDGSLNPTKNWDLPTLAGAGALRSTASDMLTFLSAALGYTESPLAPAMAAMVQPRRSAGPNTGAARTEIGLAWILTTRGDAQVVWHNGGTGGYRSMIALDRRRRVGVVVLSNAGTAAGVDDIAMHLLDPAVPLMQPPARHTQISVDPRIYDALVGRYQAAPTFVLSVTREGDRLFVQATGQPRFEIFPEGQREYFLKVVDAQITFDADVDGKAPSLTLHQNGRDLPARRIE
jgi:CubicO group peptidase (beta-lactamase class C family)